MKNILLKLLETIGANITALIVRICDCVTLVFSYLISVKKTKDEEKARKEYNELSDKIDDVTENGDLDSLFDLNRK